MLPASRRAAGRRPQLHLLAGGAPRAEAAIEDADVGVAQVIEREERPGGGDGRAVDDHLRPGPHADGVEDLAKRVHRRQLGAELVGAVDGDLVVAHQARARDVAVGEVAAAVFDVDDDEGGIGELGGEIGR